MNNLPALPGNKLAMPLDAQPLPVDVQPLPVSTGVNKLIAAATPLLLLLSRLKTLTEADALALQQLAIDELNLFEQQAKAEGFSARTILAARYCLCTALDEFALCNPWEANSLWSQHTLLSTLHQETWGGERFFIIIEKMATEPEQNGPLLELLYILLSLGFEGKYYNQDARVKEEIRHRLLHIIKHDSDPLSNHIEHCPIPLIPAANTPKKYLNCKRWLTIISLLGLMLWIGFNYNISRSAADTLESLHQLNSTAIYKANAPAIIFKEK